MKARKILAAAAVAGLALTSLAACNGNGGGGASNGSSGKPNAQSSLTATSSAINAQSRDAMKQGGTLTLGINDLPDQWNPSSVAGNEADYITVQSPLSSSFFIFDGQGNPTINKNFLQDAQAKLENGKTVVTYTMNPKAVWGDGTPMGLNDFVATWKACNGENQDFQCASTEGLEQIESIKQGSSAQEIIVTYKSTYPDWQAVFPPMKAESVKDADTFNKGWGDINNNWYSGPFKVQSVDKTAGIITEVPNDKWWGPKPMLDKIIMKVVPTEAQAAAFQNSEIDSLDIGVNADSYQRAKSRPDGEIRRAAGPNYRHVTFNTATPALQDKAVRRAIVQYLDRAQIGASDLAGMDWKVTPLNNVFLMQNQDGYKDMAQETGLKFDQAAAKKTLEDAGYKKDGDYYAKDGKTLEVNYTTLTGVKVSENEGKQFQDQMKALGIKVNITPVASKDFSTTLQKKDFQIIAFTWLGGDFPYLFPRQIFDPKSGSNYSGFNDPQAPALLNTISTEMDKQKRYDALIQISKLAWNDPQILPLYQRPSQEAVKKTLANWGAFGLASTIWENVGYTK